MWRILYSHSSSNWLTVSGPDDGEELEKSERKRIRSSVALSVCLSVCVCVFFCSDSSFTPSAPMFSLLLTHEGRRRGASLLRKDWVLEKEEKEVNSASITVYFLFETNKRQSERKRIQRTRIEADMCERSEKRLQKAWKGRKREKGASIGRIE